MKKLLLISMLMHVFLIGAQSNTATASGSIGKCSVWGYPYTLYNNAGASQTVNDQITVTVDQNRNIGAINLTGSGAMDMSGANGITLSGSAGEITCRWDIGSYGSQTIINNNGNFTSGPQGSSVSLDTGTFFTAPYAGNYRWTIGTGWSAGMSGSYLSGGFGVRIEGNNYYGNIFIQKQAGSCGMATPGATPIPPTWYPNTYSASGGVALFPLNTGKKLSYAGSTTYLSSGSCTGSRLDFTIGTATIYYEN